MNRWKYALVGLLVGAFAFPLVWNSDPLVIGQTVTVDSTQSPLVVNALADLADLTPTDGQSVVIKTGNEKGLWYYDKDSAAVVDGVAVLTGPGSVGRFLVINNASGSIAAATAITAAQIDNDVDLEFGVFDADSPRSLTLAELKKTGVQVVNVKQYGATGDGVTDDSAAIQAAVDAADDGDVVYLPPGEFYLGTNTIEIKSAGRQIVGAGFQEGGTVLISENESMPAIRFSAASYARLENLRIENESGDGVHFVGCFKAVCKDVWSGRGVRDVAFYNAGSQQLRMENCWATSNAPIGDSSVVAKYGFVHAGFIKAGTTISDTNLTGLTLTLNYAASETITVAGDTIAALVTAINSETASTGIMATALDDSVMMYSRSFSTSTGIDDDNDLVLSNGTGTWAAAGFTAATHTYGDALYVPNASVMESCHAEGMGWVNLLVTTPRHSDSARGNVRVSNCTFQGGGTTANGPAKKAMAVIDEANSCSFYGCHMESTDVMCLVLDEAHNTSMHGGLLFDIEIISTQNAMFSGVSIAGGTIDTGSTGATFIGCQITVSAGSGSTIVDSSKSATYIGCNGTNPSSNSSGSLALRTNNTDGYVVSYNGRFDYWNGTNTLPIGWAASGTPTIARYAVDNMVGNYSASVIVQASTADTGLKFVVPVVAFQHWNGTSSWVTVSFYAKRHSSAALAPSVIFDHNYKNRITAASNSLDDLYPVGTWKHHQYSCRIPANASKCEITLSPDKDGATGARMYYSAVTISLGHNAPSDYALNGLEGEKILLSGKWIDSGSAAPSSGYSLIGSIRYNSAPTSGQPAFWVCTASGDPGTWANGPNVP